MNCDVSTIVCTCMISAMLSKTRQRGARSWAIPYTPIGPLYGIMRVISAMLSKTRQRGAGQSPPSNSHDAVLHPEFGTGSISGRATPSARNSRIVFQYV